MKTFKMTATFEVQAKDEDEAQEYAWWVLTEDGVIDPELKYIEIEEGQ